VPDLDHAHGVAETSPFGEWRAADFGKLIADETEKWAKVIRSANIRL